MKTRILIVEDDPHILLGLEEILRGEDFEVTVCNRGAKSIDPKCFEIRRGKTREELTAKELKLLALFHAHPSEVLSRDKLLTEVWGYNYFGTTRTLDQVIVQLRKKLGEPADQPRHLL